MSEISEGGFLVPNDYITPKIITWLDETYLPFGTTYTMTPYGGYTRIDLWLDTDEFQS